MSARENAKNIRKRGQRRRPSLGRIDTFNLPGYEVVHFEEMPDECNVAVRTTS
jgi:hypothetical protein